MSEEPRQLSCPKCADAMETVTFGEVEVDRCTSCAGIFFDISEHEDLRTLAGSEEIDSGDRIAGRIMDDTREIDCPACGMRMVELVAMKKRDIRYEKCSQCSGVFLDAGEFTDFKKDRGFLDMLAAAISGSRS
jgi:Zn-finger nucleic acid-binding protein